MSEITASAARSAYDGAGRIIAAYAALKGAVSEGQNVS
jgi:hypothetical protein